MEEAFKKLEFSSLTEKYKPTSEPIESTKELFEGKGYVYINSFDKKWYAIGVTEKDQVILFSDIKLAKTTADELLISPSATAPFAFEPFTVTVP